MRGIILIIIVLAALIAVFLFVNSIRSNYSQKGVVIEGEVHDSTGVPAQTVQSGPLENLNRARQAQDLVNKDAERVKQEIENLDNPGLQGQSAGDRR